MQGHGAGGFQLGPGGVDRGGSRSFPHPEPPSSAHPISAPTPAANAARCPPQKFTCKGSHQLSPALIHRKPFAPLPGPKQRHPARGGKERKGKIPQKAGTHRDLPGQPRGASCSSPSCADREIHRFPAWYPGKKSKIIPAESNLLLGCGQGLPFARWDWPRRPQELNSLCPPPAGILGRDGSLFLKGGFGAAGLV